MSIQEEMAEFGRQARIASIEHLLNIEKRKFLADPSFENCERYMFEWGRHNYHRLPNDTKLMIALHDIQEHRVVVTPLVSGDNKIRAGLAEYYSMERKFLPLGVVKADYTRPHDFGRNFGYSLMGAKRGEVVPILTTGHVRIEDPPAKTVHVGMDLVLGKRGQISTGVENPARPCLFVDLGTVINIDPCYISFQRGSMTMVV